MNLLEKIKETQDLSSCEKTLVVPEKINQYLRKEIRILLSIKAPSIISRPFIKINEYWKHLDFGFSNTLKYKKECLKQVEIDIKYRGYIDRERFGRQTRNLSM